jgi:simple sugar transport system permease protein
MTHDLDPKTKNKDQRPKIGSTMKLLREILFPLIAVVAAFLVGGIIVWIIGESPIQTYKLLIGSAFSWPNGIGYTLFNATPLIFTGLAVAVAFRCGLLNIGAEGQLYVAAFATAWVGIKFGGVAITAPGSGQVLSSPYANLPMILLLPLCCLVAILAGAIWGGIPGVLKARFGSHEVINTIMLNFIAVALLSYFTQYHFKIPGDAIMQTAEISSRAHLPTLGRFIPGLPAWIPLNLSFILAVLACVAVYVFLWKTKWGYEMRATGANPSAAEYGGISIRKQIILAMAISGALAGMVGINEVLGYRHRYYDGFSANYGFVGIAVALLGRNHPVGVFLAAILFAILLRGGIFVDAYTVNVSKDIVDMLQGIVIVFVAAEAMFRGPLKKFSLMRRAKI